MDPEKQKIIETIVDRYNSGLLAFETLINSSPLGGESIKNVFLQSAKSPKVEACFENSDEKALFEAFEVVNSAKLLMLVSGLAKEQFNKTEGEENGEN